MYNISRRQILQSALVSALPLAGAGSVLAQDYPSKPIRIVVPYGPGGLGDFTARALGKYLGEQWKNPVVVENKAGAAGMVAMNSLKGTPSDGHTLVMTSNTTLSAARHVFKSLAYDPDADFRHVGMLGTFCSVALTAPGSPFKTIPELVAFARKNPDKAFFAYTNASSLVPAEMLNSYAKLDLQGVAYKETGQALVDLMSGRVAFMFQDAVAATPHLKSGKLIPLAVTQEARAPQWPQVQTMREFYPGFEFTGFVTVSAPAGIPQAAIAKLNAAIRSAVRTDEFRKLLESNSLNTLDLSLEDLAKFIASQNSKWDTYARIAKLEPQ